MEIIIPVIFMSAVFYQLYLYGRAVYMRRMVMMKRVTDFLERTDASTHLKIMAVSAFDDAVSVRLPLHLLGFRRKRQANDPMAKKAEKRARESLRKDKSSALARQELDSLIEMMMTINLSFNKVLFLLACLPHMRVERKEVSRAFYADSMQQMQTREIC